MSADDRDLRDQLWDRAYESRHVAAAFKRVEKLLDEDKQAEAEEAEKHAQQLHDAEYQRLCNQNAKALDEEAERNREQAEFEAENEREDVELEPERTDDEQTDDEDDSDT